uniref:Uncharacterized protein n=1 Tax=Spongospora subterranea TaxID=70186 RepID=A0A0H5QXP8_9EUKA|eukprot:CRZ06401.1 hypothetical protein [Spongospora subterranea]
MIVATALFPVTIQFTYTLLSRNTMDNSSHSTSNAPNEAPKFGRRRNSVKHGSQNGEPANETKAEVAGTGAGPENTGKKWVDDIVADVDAIPDLSNVNDDAGATIAGSPVFMGTDNIQSLDELDEQIGFQLNTNTEGVDLSLLTRVMFSPELLNEPDVPWEMDLLLSQIASEIQIGKDFRSTQIDDNIQKQHQGSITTT